MNSKLYPFLILVHNFLYMILRFINFGFALSRSIQPKKVWLAKCVLPACILLVTKSKFYHL